jgi:hypothetical protein
MNRRQALAALATAVGSGGLAGCAGIGAVGSTTETGTASGESGGGDSASRTPDPTRLARRGVPPTICEEDRPTDPGIYAVTDPVFGDDWRELSVADRYRPVGVDESSGLAPAHSVVGLTDGETARAFPVGILWHHEIVNTGSEAAPTDDPVMVTFCPLCGSGLVASRVVAGDPTVFLVSGLLWKAPRIQTGAAEAEGTVFGADSSGGGTPSIRNNGNLVMSDRATESYWSQVLATGICGPAEGTELAVVPSTVTTWATWRESHPDTEVLLPPPHSGTVDPG